MRTNEGRSFQTVGAQHGNGRAAMFVNEDCVDSMSDVDDFRTRDCLNGESRQVRYEGCCSLKALYNRGRKSYCQLCCAQVINGESFSRSTV